MVSVSGDGGFDDPENPGNPHSYFQQMLDYINEDYPQAEASYNAHTQTTYDFDIKAPVQARDEITEFARDTVAAIQTHPRRWNMPQASRDIMITNGGTFSATAAQIASGGHLVDRLLI